MTNKWFHPSFGFCVYVLTVGFRRWRQRRKMDSTICFLLKSDYNIDRDLGWQLRKISDRLWAEERQKYGRNG